MSTRYTVRPGDSLSSIATRNGFSSWRDIYDHPDNALLRARRPTPNVIVPGDVIIIPDAPAMDPGSKTPAAAPAAAAAPATAPDPCALPPTSAFASWPVELLATLC